MGLPLSGKAVFLEFVFAGGVDRKILLLLMWQIKVQEQTIITLQQQLLNLRNEQTTSGLSDIEARWPVTLLDELEPLHTYVMSADVSENWFGSFI